MRGVLAEFQGAEEQGKKWKARCLPSIRHENPLALSGLFGTRSFTLSNVRDRKPPFGVAGEVYNHV